MKPQQEQYAIEIIEDGAYSHTITGTNLLDTLASAAEQCHLTNEQRFRLWQGSHVFAGRYTLSIRTSKGETAEVAHKTYMNTH